MRPSLLNLIMQELYHRLPVRKTFGKEMDVMVAEL